jgi:hypothetical protein
MAPCDRRLRPTFTARPGTDLDRGAAPDPRGAVA